MDERGITQTQVADVLDRSQGYVSHRLTGKNDLSMDIIVAVAQLSGLAPRALMVELTERTARGYEPAPRTGQLPRLN